MKMKKNIGSKILLGAGIVLLLCYLGGIFYIYNIAEYNPYASAGADVNAFIHSVLILPPTVICLVLSLILHVKAKKNKTGYDEHNVKLMKRALSIMIRQIVTASILT